MKCKLPTKTRDIESTTLLPLGPVTGLDSSSDIYDGSVTLTCNAVDGHMGVHPTLCRWGWFFLENWGMADHPEWCSSIMVEAPNPLQTASHIHLTYVQSVLAPWYSMSLSQRLCLSLRPSFCGCRVTCHCASPFNGWCYLWPPHPSPLARSHAPLLPLLPLLPLFVGGLSRCHVVLPGSLASLSSHRAVVPLHHCTPLIVILLLPYGWLLHQMWWPPILSHHCAPHFLLAVACLAPRPPPHSHQAFTSPLSLLHSRLVGCDTALHHCRPTIVIVAYEVDCAPLSFPPKYGRKYGCRNTPTQNYHANIVDYVSATWAHLGKNKRQNGVIMACCWHVGDISRQAWKCYRFFCRFFGIPICGLLIRPGISEKFQLELPAFRSEQNSGSDLGLQVMESENRNSQPYGSTCHLKKKSLLLWMSEPQFNLGRIATAYCTTEAGQVVRGSLIHQWEDDTRNSAAGAWLTAFPNRSVLLADEWRDRCGASQCGTQSNAINLIVWLFL